MVGSPAGSCVVECSRGCRQPACFHLYGVPAPESWPGASAGSRGGGGGQQEVKHIDALPFALRWLAVQAAEAAEAAEVGLRMVPYRRLPGLGTLGYLLQCRCARMCHTTKAPHCGSLGSAESNQLEGGTCSLCGPCRVRRAVAAPAPGGCAIVSPAHRILES